MSDRLITSTLPVPKKGFGGLKEVLQLMSKTGSMEQPDPMPMPNGYGTVRFPHWLWQPGLVMVVALAVELVEAVEAKERQERRRKNKPRGENMAFFMF